MCIAVFIWQAHPYCPLLLLLNRDEYHNRQATLLLLLFSLINGEFMVMGGLDRATKELSWWEGGEILGGKDEVAGGTWLACSRNGRVAFITNVLELDILPEAKSRGDLPVRFLQVKLLRFSF